MEINKYIDKLKRYPTAWLGHGLFATQLVEEFKPNVVVDLGVDYGYSTFCFGYHNIGNVYGVDWFQGDQHAGSRDTYDRVIELYNELKKGHDFSNIEFIKGDFDEVAKTWDKQIDILHVDGFHSYEAVKNDFETWSKFCTEDSIILFHDTISFPTTVGKFFEELDGFKINKTDSFGLGILTKSETKYNKILSWI
jgi:hypothetical protein